MTDSSGTADIKSSIVGNDLDCMLVPMPGTMPSIFQLGWVTQRVG